MGRSTTSRSRKQRHDPLLKDIDSAQGNLKKHYTKRNQVTKEGNEDDEDEEYIDAKHSRKILQLARDQQDEIAEEENTELQREVQNKARFQHIDYDDDEDDEDEQEGDFSDFEPEGEFGEEMEEEEIVELDEEDAAMFEQYFKKADDFNAMNGSYNLADKIMASVREKEAEIKETAIDIDDNEADQGEHEAQKRPMDGVALPEKVIRAYTTVGTVLKTWTHGKLPKLFKVIPSLRNWQDVLYVTNPEAWSPHVVYEATKLFVSNLQAKEAQKFISMVLLERFRDNIENNEDHSLNYHIYRAIKKSIYKPSAFFKGFLFPLVETGCNIREATIAGSVLTKVSVPALHSSAALSYLLRLPFSPATTVFIKILLDKKYALPYQTVDECVYYFMRFRIVEDGSTGEDSTRALPVIWHKAFLVFAQRYKNDITEDQRDFLLETVRQRGHRDIGPEIRRELMAGNSREFVDPNQAKDDMMIDVQ
ncbi:similar to Saccharomyces cerevisiae YBR247C ENP1 Protein associated with U3 and U14 snoRNAs, required for pre-rRNA processing and 40S ribosomal subunit synthesis [Maudiozyma barnettii]|uniref:Similar to Saccharomyces cerevisiae YBR247C ENP1 Protein associated with U3 and U14 snoRNAs, required for pre-rRNA processing and 40S ribosomal subunit synthesis n=1 Tax=Maudiozyma barnettii TaxID=61262 RepID=A0A8H2VJP6_9SACH|nr:snoRNA-binding rRNA-processing protein ENP1 [Kazachstania barnettii]CAB4256677.1 similar to Saccharomyces cerevisiae YBR247C ENP1 Protein associated with U3 and U14 snoRNAs, required for pre-rRNA processing and 40S ribosomal subunit synthesis [Kazachstania barnettii]CAD1785332.1 similar to Saccharomyces cerevisiae YBR247C ENP1 Protein associated with U3 and U14 snoRNAs, required for pre-rRNA processing and 40S ribosomal subunit synthesis [Kazachstania barnettii]